MRSVLFIFVFLLGCNSTNQGDNFEPFKATVYLEHPTDTPYNMFQVIDSNFYDKPEINIHYEDYLNNHPDKKDIIESDTVNVDVLPYISDYGSKRYKLLGINP